MDEDFLIESIPSLQVAIRELHGCNGVHVEAVHVREEFGGKIVWEGDVQVFDLLDHPTAKRAYAWSHPTAGTKSRFVVVLHAGPVVSPATAVQASIVADEKAKRS